MQILLKAMNLRCLNLGFGHALFTTLGVQGPAHAIMPKDQVGIGCKTYQIHVTGLRRKPHCSFPQSAVSTCRLINLCV